MDEPVITAQELQERTVPDLASVAAMVAMAMRMRSAWKPKRLDAIPIHVGVTSSQPLASSTPAISP
jgi:hypothetical protein